MVSEGCSKELGKRKWLKTALQSRAWFANMAYCAPHSGSDFVYLKWKIESKEDDKKAKNMKFCVQ